MRRSDLALAATLLFACGNSHEAKPPGDHAHDHMGHAGHVLTEPPAANKDRGASLPISCGPDAQQPFDRGFWFLHNMDYVSARHTFEGALVASPKCAMLSWGAA